MTDTKISVLRELLKAGADPGHAAYHKAYHKSSLRFYGLRTPALNHAVAQAFPKRPALTRGALEPVVRELWRSPWFEERVAALMLLERITAELGPADLPWLKQITAECEGWGMLDHLACRTLGPLALRHAEPVYLPVFGWLNDEWLWTRRAAILLHVIPARKSRLDHHYAWPTFEARLHEREFFIRKAIGWALRECSKHYPQEVYALLSRVGDRASALTRREGARNLPTELRAQLPG